ncbi:hypothetical protein AUP68_08209 [Ilyonectria robusta]
MRQRLRQIPGKVPPSQFKARRRSKHDKHYISVSANGHRDPGGIVRRYSSSEEQSHSRPSKKWGEMTSSGVTNATKRVLGKKIGQEIKEAITSTAASAAPSNTVTEIVNTGAMRMSGKQQKIKKPKETKGKKGNGKKKRKDDKRKRA